MGLGNVPRSPRTLPLDNPFEFADDSAFPLVDPSVRSPVGSFPRLKAGSSRKL